MARLTTLRALPPLRLPQAPGLAPEDLEFFKPAQGINTAARLSELPRGFAATTKNVRIVRGKFKSRPPAGALGGSAVDPLMHAFEFKTIDGTPVQLRFTTKKLQRFDGTAWTDVVGATFTGGVSDFFTVTTFGSLLVFSNGVDGLFVYDPAAGTITQITTSGNVPKAKHLTTFAGRVVATNVIDSTGSKPTRLRWTAKNDHTKWNPAVDLGSGFEDVTASPSPDVDVCYATLPITDELALIFRKRSVWLMSVTGFIDAPFRFSLLHDQLGTDSPYSLAAVPGGVCGFFENNFYIVNNSQIAPIGDAIVDELHDKVISPRDIFGTFDAVNLEYRAIVKEDTAVWRYSFRDKGWARDVYPFTPKSIAAVGHYGIGNLTIDQLTGFIDGLTGVIDELGITAVVHGGAYLTQAGTGGQFVVRENPTLTQDSNASGVSVDSEIEIRTGLILPKSPLEKVEVLEAQLEYEAEAAQTLLFEYSTDGGTVWLSYSSVSIVATAGPDVLSVRRTVAAKKIQLRVRSTTLGKLRLLALHVFATRGAKVKP